ncbi:DUF4058 family protein [Microseira wollei]|uniref:DUF4058 family protein n=1 Tax=Microseira wollei NIES-4236 TaxID=2530354 RepID=A0AAV3XKU7_9CYAN|nr:DUF4058 family protein [Microseira wollei]GET43099.1 hypothetical protein MiSe_79200 [Microseira wollei NIES-4236]
MPSPFPGMNPYLENPDLWSEVHHRLITAIAIALSSNLSLRYRVAIEKRTYLNDGEESVSVAIPDVSVYSQSSTPVQTSSTATLPAQAESVAVIIPLPEEMREGYLEIREVETGDVITVIEVLSPTNKRAGRGRKAYNTKRLEVLSTPTHLVEIDLLRSGKPMRILSDIPKTDYRILICPGNRRPHAQLYAFNVRQEMPKFLLPLQPGDTEPLVDLQSLLVEVYEQARFDMAIDYRREPVPPLKEEDRIWADALLREKGLR